MQISRNIVKGPKSNNQVSVGIWVIVCIQKPSHHFLQTIRPLGYACLTVCLALVHFIQKLAIYLSVKADQRKC